MSTVVIEPPTRIIEASDMPATIITGSALEAIIGAAQEAIDGPTGWVGRSFGRQTLETLIDAQAGRWMTLPYPPIASVVSVKSGETGSAVSYEVDASADKRIRVALSGKIVVRFTAGYDAGKVPEVARQAVIIAASHLANLDMSELSVRTEDVEGVGSTTYSVSNAALEMVEAVTRNLLRGLKVIRP